METWYYFHFLFYFYVALLSENYLYTKYYYLLSDTFVSHTFRYYYI